MNNIRKFETKENRIDREIKELNEQLPEINEEIKTGFDRFDLKLNNGGTITKDDVRSLFSGIGKKHKVLEQVQDKMQEKGIDMSDVPTMDDIAMGVLEAEAWESRKK